MPRLDFAALGVTAPVSFEGGIIFLVGYGCRHCGGGFWVEVEGPPRFTLHPNTPHPCPICSVISLIPERRTFG